MRDRADRGRSGLRALLGRTGERRARRHRARPRDLAAGLPALLGFALLAFWGTAGPEPLGLADHYWEMSRRRAAEGDHAGARLCLKRVLGLRPDWHEARLAEAVALDAEGRSLEAEALGRALAGGSSCYAPAQLWLARRLLEKAGRTPRNEAEAESLLLRHVATDPEQSEGRGLLGRLYIDRGRPDLARKQLTAMAKGRPEGLLALAKLDTAAGDAGGARGLAAEARHAFLLRTERSPWDKGAWLFLAEADLLLGNPEGAAEAVREGLLLDGEDADLRRATAAVQLARFDALTAQPGADGRALLDVLLKGLDYAPADPGLLARLEKFAGPAAPDRARDAAPPRGRPGGPGAAAHLAAGNVAWAEGRKAEARAGWEAALRADPGLSEASKNLAWLLAHASPPDYGAALAVVERAVARQPGDVGLLAARGLLLLKTGRAGPAAGLGAAVVAGGDAGEAGGAGAGGRGPAGR